MATSPFRPAPTPKPRNWIQRFMHLGYPDRAAVALRTSLTSVSPVEMSSAHVSDIMQSYGVTGPKVRRVLLDVWSGALAVFLKDHTLSEAETCYLEQLARAFGLSQKELFEARHDVTAPIFETAVSEAVGDGQLTAAEKSELASLAKRLQLPPEDATRLYEAAASEKLSVLTDQVLADARVSPDEERVLRDAAASLGVPLSTDAATRSRLQRFALYWRIENADIPSIAVPIALQRGETAYWTGQADWHEIRTRTTRVNYGGPTLSIRIAKGVRYRVGSIALQRITREELTHIDSGQLYITSKRLIFDGAKKNTAIRHSALLGFSLFKDGFVLEKASGRSPHLTVRGDLELAAVIMSAVLASG